MSTLNKQPTGIPEADLAIIGGGSAGISLASQLYGLSAVIIEPKTPAERDCSWALWANAEQQKQLAPCTKGRWKQWRLIDHQREIIHRSDQYSYTSLSAAQYLSQCENNLADGIELIRASAENIQVRGNGGSFTAAGQTYSAAQLYDSRPPTMADNCLKQHFLGLEIRTKSPIENPEIATLMDFRVDQSRGLHFIYVLPFSDDLLLIESTMISRTIEDKNWYLNAIHQWLEQQNIEPLETISQEQGVIPMDRVEPIDAGIANIGAASGAVRLSSGYAFTNIQAQVSALARGIRGGQYEVPEPIAPSLIRMDKIFNAVLLAEPELGVSVMMSTASALDANGFARFMLGSASLLDWARVIMAMPKLPFLKQVFTP